MIARRLFFSNRQRTGAASNAAACGRDMMPTVPDNDVRTGCPLCSAHARAHALARMSIASANSIRHFFAHSGATTQPLGLIQPRQELEDLMQRKALVEDQIAQVEAQIYEVEGAYLEETAQTGNVIKGFDGYIMGTAGSRPSGSANRKARFKESDRLFSRSSATYERVLFGCTARCV